MQVGTLSRNLMQTMIFDISPRVCRATGVFPGDVPFERTLSMTRDAGQSVNLSSIRSTVHLGAHADAPWHYDDEGLDIAGVPLEAYWGPALVIRCQVDRGQRVSAEEALKQMASFASGHRPWRCLIHTGTFPDPNKWNRDFAALSPELIWTLKQRECVLVGIDTPSVDPESSEDLPSHRALFETGILNLEGLVLDHIEAGWYELVALPLKLMGLDGSPVRAALRTLRP